MVLSISVGVPAGHHDNTNAEHLRRDLRSCVKPSRRGGGERSLRLLLVLQAVFSCGDPIVDRCEPDRAVPLLRHRHGAWRRVVSSRRSVSPPHAPAQRRWPNEVGEMAILATCRAGCGACCIAPSISPCASLPDGKPADVRCPHLTSDLRCALFGRPERPATCVSLRPQPEMCGESAGEAIATLIAWERLTRPGSTSSGVG